MSTPDTTLDFNVNLEVQQKKKFQYLPTPEKAFGNVKDFATPFRSTTQTVAIVYYSCNESGVIFCCNRATSVGAGAIGFDCSSRMDCLL